MPKGIIKSEKIDHFLEALIVAFILLSLMFIVFPKEIWPSYYTPRFFSTIAFLSAMLIYLLKTGVLMKSRSKARAWLLLCLAFSIALVLNILGELFFYQLYYYGFPYDKVLHFAVPFIFTTVLAMYQRIIFKTALGKAALISVCLVLAGGLLWEVIEYFSDYFFKTSQFGIYGQEKTTDTFFDILFDVFGVGIGAYLLFDKGIYRKHIRKWWAV